MKTLKTSLFIAIVLIAQTTVNAQWSLTGNAGTNPATNFIGTTDDQALSLMTSGVVQMTLSKNGNLGIGDTTPDLTNAISIKKDNWRSLNINLQNTNINGYASVITQNDRGSLASYGGFLHPGSNWSYSLFGNLGKDKTVFFSDGASSEGMMVGTLTAKPLIFGANNIETMRTLANGNIGIGTTTPFAKLQVAGNVIVDESLTIKELKIVTGANSMANLSTTGSSGVVTINTNKVHSNSIIVLTPNNSGANDWVKYGNIIDGVSFDVMSSLGAGSDVGFTWVIINQP